MKGKGIKSLILLLTINLLMYSADAFADYAVGYFTVEAPGFFEPIPEPVPGGEVTFNLNADGTIAASLISYYEPIYGFGFDSITNLPESNFSPKTPTSTSRWSDTWGNQMSGFYISSTIPAGVIEKWTIGQAGEFTSVFDALDGGLSTHPFFLDGPYALYAGDISTAPIPGTVWLFGSGLAGLIGLKRKYLG
jgi:hypothetical protein